MSINNNTDDNDGGLFPKSSKMTMIEFLPCHLKMLKALHQIDDDNSVNRSSSSSSSCNDAKDYSIRSRGNHDEIWSFIESFLKQRKSISAQNEHSSRFKCILDEAKFMNSIASNNDNNNDTTSNNNTININETPNNKRKANESRNDKTKKSKVFMNDNHNNQQKKKHVPSSTSLSFITQSQATLQLQNQMPLQHQTNNTDNNRNICSFQPQRKSRHNNNYSPQYYQSSSPYHPMLSFHHHRHHYQSQRSPLPFHNHSNYHHINGNTNNHPTTTINKINSLTLVSKIIQKQYITIQNKSIKKQNPFLPLIHYTQSEIKILNRLVKDLEHSLFKDKDDKVEREEENESSRKIRNKAVEKKRRGSDDSDKDNSEKDYDDLDNFIINSYHGDLLYKSYQDDEINDDNHMMKNEQDKIIDQLTLTRSKLMLWKLLEMSLRAVITYN